MMRALKTAALALFAMAAVCAALLVAASPLGAEPGAAPGDAGGQAVAGVAGDGAADMSVTAGTPSATDGKPDASSVPGVGAVSSLRVAPTAGAAPGAATAPGVGALATAGPEPSAKRAETTRQAATPSATHRTPGAPTAVHTATAHPTAHPPVHPTASGSPAHPAKAMPSVAVAAAVKEAAGHGIRLSVSVLDRANGTVAAQVDPDLALPSMSLVKLFIAVDLLDRSGAPGALDEATAQTLWRMITLSDDNAASRLWIDGGDGAIVQRIAKRFGLSGVAPPASAGMWGDTTVTADDVARFLRTALTDPSAGSWLAHAMRSAAGVGADGFDQDFGMNAVTGAGSKQGWGCCLRGVRSLDSAGFTGSRVVVVLSEASPGTSYAAMRSALTTAVRAALRH